MLQEFRGDRFDGGSKNVGKGQFRLSPSIKELLVETDVMMNVPNMPNDVGIKEIMDRVARSFAELTIGAGMEMYWINDKTRPERLAHEVFDTSTPQGEDRHFDWHDKTRNVKMMLNKFVHLMLVDKNIAAPNDLGAAPEGYGAFVYVGTIWNKIMPGDDFKRSIGATAAHELIHLLLDNPTAQDGFDQGEHVLDPNEDGINNGLGDEIYLMTAKETDLSEDIIFDDKTRRQLNLTSKESVERVHQ